MKKLFIILTLLTLSSITAQEIRLSIMSKEQHTEHLQKCLLNAILKRNPLKVSTIISEMKKYNVTFPASNIIPTLKIIHKIQKHNKVLKRIAISGSVGLCMCTCFMLLHTMANEDKGLIEPRKPSWYIKGALLGAASQISAFGLFFHFYRNHDIIRSLLRSSACKATAEEQLIMRNLM